jgi:hypothetical protein
MRLTPFAGLIEILAVRLVAEGFARDSSELISMARDFRTLRDEPQRGDLAWRYGIGSEILDPLPYSRNRQLAAGGGEDFQLITSKPGPTLLQNR